MRTTRIIITSLATVLSAAAVAGPAAAAPTDPAVSPPVAQKAPTWPTDPQPIEQPPVAQKAPTWPIDPQPITQHGMAATATSSGFAWGSAVIAPGRTGGCPRRCGGRQPSSRPTRARRQPCRVAVPSRAQPEWETCHASARRDPRHPEKPMYVPMSARPAVASHLQNRHDNAASRSPRATPTASLRRQVDAGHVYVLPTVHERRRRLDATFDPRTW